MEPIVTVEPGTCMVLRPEYDQRVHNGRQLGQRQRHLAAQLEEVGLENAMKTGGWCVQVLVAGGPSEMQRAEESMARSEASRSSSFTSTRSRFSSDRWHNGAVSEGAV